MKLLFFGDCMFGRDNRVFFKNPFIHVKSVIKNADVIFFNLETVISPIPIDDKYKWPEKTFHYQSTGIQLLELKKMCKGKLVFVSATNNHSFDFSYHGLKATMTFLHNNRFLAPYKTDPIIKDNICFFDMSDHCGCQHPGVWAKHVWLVDLQNKKNWQDILDKVKKYQKYFVVFSIHWGSNWLKHVPHYMTEFGKALIDNGVQIVFGHSAHHIPPKAIKIYNNGLIIYGLGDFVNDYSVNKNYKSDEALMCMIDNLKVQKIKVKREFVEGSSSIPFLVNK